MIPHTPCSPENRRPVADVLRDLIVSGAVAPGTRLTEMELCRTFNRSRSSVREAIRVLTSEGLIELLPNRGQGEAARHRGNPADFQRHRDLGCHGRRTCRRQHFDCRYHAHSRTALQHGRGVSSRWAPAKLLPRLNQAIHEAIWQASEKRILVQELERTERLGPAVSLRGERQV